MKALLHEKLHRLANALDAPLYVVGGFTRDFLAGLKKENADIDLCGPISPETLTKAASSVGLEIKAVYKNTGTVKLGGDGDDYEFASFRSDKYVRGVHAPVEIFFTDDIFLDARRRDFTVNAVYYDIKNECFVDPLNGIDAIKEKRLSTVDKADKVFGEDGLRLMRLARQCAQLGFFPDEECLRGAQKNAALILDISPERIFAELLQILSADEKYGFSDGHYQGLLLLEKIGVLEKILPELTLGKGMVQRSDYHKYDVLGHSLRAVRYAKKEVRLAALLHDVGKPLCHLRDGNAYAHPEEGEVLARDILSRLKAPKKTVSHVCELVKWHMYDFDCKAKENRLRKFFVANYPLLPDLLALKQADFSGCKDDLTKAPTVQKWEELLIKMRAEHAPTTVRELAVSGKELIDDGLPPELTALVLKELLTLAVCDPSLNQKERLKKLLPVAIRAAEQKKENG
ncbi:MAG: CCA tRNA nucleotidyltransferase [Clostridia bacterium]|nr:CCA tRNA nucleotidyltransferase [Clostridia bacterium]